MADTQSNNIYTEIDVAKEQMFKEQATFMKNQKILNDEERRNYLNQSDQIDTLRGRIVTLERDKVSMENMIAYINLVRLDNKNKVEDSDEEEVEKPVPEAKWRRDYDAKYKKLKTNMKILKDVPSRVVELEHKANKHKVASNNSITMVRETIAMEAMRTDNLENDVEEMKETLKRKLDKSYLNTIPDRKDKSAKRSCFEDDVKSMQKSQAQLLRHNEKLTDLVLEMSNVIGTALGDGNKTNPFLRKIKTLLETMK